MSLPIWAEGPFELILHGELHYRAGGDFDRRMALISFDNSIEVSITTYLSLDPIHRKNRQYRRDDVEKWLSNFHTKIDFFLVECGNWGLSIRVDKPLFVWYHGIRNDQYHIGGPSIPEDRAIRGIREAALWVYAVLYDIPTVDQILEERIQALVPKEIKSSREKALDLALDSKYGFVQIAGQNYYISEVLHSVDPVAYRELALEALANSRGEEVEVQ
jgi:hypothetical protein